MKGNVNNVIRIPTSLDGQFFKYWLTFLRPFHNLTDREIEVATEFLKQRFELSDKIKEEDLLDRVVMSDDVKKNVREGCNVSLPHFQVIMGKLRKNKFIVEGKINPKFIPNIEKDGNNFQLLLFFDLKK